MKVLFYSIKDFEQPYVLQANKEKFILRLTDAALSIDTAEMANGFDTISVFTGDDVSAPVLEKLHKNGVQFIAIRAAGYDNVDLVKAKELGMQVANVPAYSPHSIAEHALALMLALNRKLIIADHQVHRHNFKMNNLVGFDLHGKTVGIIGTGKIGSTLVKILKGFGCNILGHDIHPNEELTKNSGVEYKSLEELCRLSDIISIHTCLTPQTKYLINKNTIAQMKPGVMLINTSRGGCVNTADVLQALENKHIGYFGTDVYEKERGLFFYDYSNKSVNDDVLLKLLAMPNVLVTPHQAFATREAIGNIVETTFQNIAAWAKNKYSVNELFQSPFITTPLQFSAL
ncbi:MAG: 2-hydroxyacid dehydrogenase [Bacteroidota bacterium]